MRVISGALGGRLLVSVRGMSTRPTSDPVKEALFNILAPVLERARVLDLFSGTGALAIEALSRGAASAALVESEEQACRVIRRNLANLDLSEVARVYRGPVSGVVPWMGRHGYRFDGIFVDPPYRRGLIVDTLERVARARILEPNGWLVAEHEAREWPGDSGPWRIVRRSRYGDTGLTIYVLEGDPTARPTGQDPEGRLSR